MLDRIGHIPMPYSVQGSSINYIVEHLCAEHQRAGGENVVALANNRDARVSAAENVLVDYTGPCPRGYYSNWESRIDVVRGRVGLGRRLYPQLFSPAVAALLRKDPDVIVVHEGHHATEVLPSIVKTAGPTRVAVHVNTPPSRGYSRRELREFLRPVDAIVVASQSIADMLEHRTKSTLSIDVVPNGVGDVFFESTWQPVGSLVTFVGQVAEHKGVHLMLEALARIADRHPDLRVRIIGSAHHAAESGLSDYELGLRKFSEARFRPGAVEFVPYADRTMVADSFAESRVVCVPSIWPEPFGMVAAEAMAAGAPVLAARAGGLVDFVPEADLLDPTDVAEFGERIDHYLVDSHAGRAASVRNRELAEAYSWPRVYERWHAAIAR